MPSDNTVLTVVDISVRFESIAALLFNIGVPGSLGEKASVSPPKMIDGSIQINIIGIIIKAITAIMIFPITLRFSQTNPAAAP